MWNVNSKEAISQKAALNWFKQLKHEQFIPRRHVSMIGCAFYFDELFTKVPAKECRNNGIISKYHWVSYSHDGKATKSRRMGSPWFEWQQESSATFSVFSWLYSLGFPSFPIHRECNAWHFANDVKLKARMDDFFESKPWDFFRWGIENLVECCSGVVKNNEKCIFDWNVNFLFVLFESLNWRITAWK